MAGLPGWLEVASFAVAIWACSLRGTATEMRAWRRLSQPRVSLLASSRERSEEHTSELQSPYDLVCRLLLEKKRQAVRSTTGVDLRRLFIGTDGTLSIVITA